MNFTSICDIHQKFNDKEKAIKNEKAAIAKNKKKIEWKDPR